MMKKTVKCDAITTDDAPSFAGASTTFEHITNFLYFVVHCFSPIGMANLTLKKAYKKYAKACLDQHVSPTDELTWKIQQVLIFDAYVDEARTIPASENLPKLLKDKLFGEEYNPHIKTAVLGVLGEAKKINTMNRACAKELMDKKWNSLDSAIESAIKVYGQLETKKEKVA